MMPPLTFKRWVRWPLNVGDNLSRPKEAQVCVEVRGGLTVLERRECDASFAEVAPTGEEKAHLQKQLSSYVRVPMAFELDGAQVTDLASLLAVAEKEASVSIVADLVGAILSLNSITGGQMLFSERRAGGAFGTAPVAAAETE